MSDGRWRAFREELVNPGNIVFAAVALFCLGDLLSGTRGLTFLVSALIRMIGGDPAGSFKLVTILGNFHSATAFATALGKAVGIICGVVVVFSWGRGLVESLMVKGEG